MGYDYSIQYKSRSSNVVADAISRIPADLSAACFTLSMPNYVFLDQLRVSLQDHSDFAALLTHMGITKTLHCLQGNYF